MVSYYPQSLTYEEKKFTFWAFLIALPMVAGLVYLVYIMRETLFPWFLLPLFALSVGIFALYNIAFYSVKVFDDGALQFGFPNWYIKLQSHEIKSIEEIEYRPIKDFGGLGWRIGRKDGKWRYGYVVWLQKGIQVENTNGRQYVFGTNDPPAILSAVKQSGGPARI